MATEYSGFNDFLMKHNASNFKDKRVTHTRIGDKNKTKRIFGGSYVIQKEELPLFFALYYDHVFVKKNKEHLTEVQLKDGGTIAIDLDFRYDINITERQHTPEDIENIVLLYLDILKKYFIFNDKDFDIFVFEKPNVNIVKEKNITKDGIHILINIKTDHITQGLIRQEVMKEMNNVLNLPLTNSWKEVFDEGISKGTTNWQLFGSRKPHNEAYELTYHYNISVDEDDGEFMMEEKNIKDCNLKENFHLLSVQNDNLCEFPKTSQFETDYNYFKSNYGVKKYGRYNKLTDEEENIGNEELPDMKDWTDLDKKIWILRKRFGEGQHTKYYQIIQAIRNSHNAKESELLCQKYTLLYGSGNKKNEFSSWYKSVKKNTGSEKTLTLKSVDYWCIEDNLILYNKIFEKDTLKNGTSNEITIIIDGDKEACQILWDKTYKDRLKYTNEEYFMKINNRWSKSTKEIEAIITTEILNDANLYTSKENSKGQETICGYSNKRKYAVEIRKSIMDRCVLEKDDNFINNFSKTNKNKLCFKNGVLDLTNKSFSSWEENQNVYTTIIIPNDYVAEKNEDDITIVKELIQSIFGEKYELALQYFARALGGNTNDKNWSIFMGTRNCGKGVIEMLLRATFCDYIGSASSTYFICKNKEEDVKDFGWVQDIQFNRIVLVQEFQESKNTLVNGTTIKSFSGGDFIENRKLHKDAIKTLPEGSLMLLNNSMPKYAEKTENCIKNCISFTSVNQYVSQDIINQAIDEKCPQSYIDTLKVGDNDIKQKVKTSQYSNAFIHLICDFWKDTPVPCINDFKDDENEHAVDYGKLICKSFQFSDNKNDKPLKVSKLKKWCNNNSVVYAKQLKPYWGGLNLKLMVLWHLNLLKILRST
jgi:hypothetical protein